VRLAPDDYQLHIHCRRARPDSNAKQPSFSLNATPLDFNETVTEDGQQTAYHLTVPASLVKKGEADQLDITIPTWSPKKVHGNSDDRELGLLIDTITFESL